MLFALIKAHAPLFRFQWELFTTATGDEGIRATVDDVTAAARLYREFSTSGGGDAGGMAAILQQHGGTFRQDKTGHSNRMVEI